VLKPFDACLERLADAVFVPDGTGQGYLAQANAGDCGVCALAKLLGEPVDRR
jgi:hypothetical protein